MCHADIRSNVITDFGFGNTWFMGGASATLDGSQTWYNNLASTWQSAKQIKGSVYVPNQPVTAAAMTGIGSTGVTPLKIADFMNTPYKPGWNFDNDPTQIGRPMSLKIQPEPGKEKVISKNVITIRAPYEYEIEGLAPDLFNSGSTVGAKRLGSNASLQLVAKGNYMMNDESAALECADADIVVKGPLFLRGLRVDASKGCRIYVSGSVFIEDAITYVGNGVQQNLQITSANGIFMGISSARLRGRFADSRGLQLAGTRNFASRSAQAQVEADSIGVLKDAQDSYSPRASINYTGLLLNAPMVQSRYLGNIKGTIIAEAALFALGEFHFEFDPVFGEVNVFPKLLTPIIIVE